eukprot:6966041-Lingulodinium_polyedra.AAC.1
MLQETHWERQLAATWGRGIPTRTTVANDGARPGPRGGPQNGVTVLRPVPWRLMEERCLVPGRA